MHSFNSKKKGFTLIEILIVLAIISLVVLLGISSYGIAQKKVRLDMAANTVQALIVEARDKSKAGFYENTGDVLEAKSLCYGFKAYPGGSFELLTTTYNPLELSGKCSNNLNDIKIVKKLETSKDIILKKIISYGQEQTDPVVIFFQPPKAEIEISNFIYIQEPLIKFNVGYSNSENILDQRQVVFNVLTGTVKMQTLSENNENK